MILEWFPATPSVLPLSLPLNDRQNVILLTYSQTLFTSQTLDCANALPNTSLLILQRSFLMVRMDVSHAHNLAASIVKDNTAVHHGIEARLVSRC